MPEIKVWLALLVGMNIVQCGDLSRLEKVVNEMQGQMQCVLPNGGER